MSDYDSPGEFEEAIFKDATIEKVVVTIKNDARNPDPEKDFQGAVWRD